MTRSIFGKCDVCALNLKVGSLSVHHRHLIGKLHQVLEKRTTNHGKYFVVPIPQKACEFCLLKIESFGSLASQLLPQKYLNGNMQTNPHGPKKDNDTNNSTEDQPHQYNCECHECQIKFGSLPLLVQVIECQEKSSLENTATSSASADMDCSDNLSLSLSEPSTSSAHLKPCASVSSHKTMVCPHCNKNFTHRGDLNKHVRKHTGEQPYMCHVCKRKFAHTSNLNRHLKVHSGDRPFICNACNKTFSRKDKLEMHKKTKLCKKFSEKML